MSLLWFSLVTPFALRTFAVQFFLLFYFYSSGCIIIRQRYGKRYTLVYALSACAVVFDKYVIVFSGNGDMAMSNTLGANTLDILLCLGLPWLIKILMDKKDIEIVSGALRYSVLSIIVCVVAFYAVTALCKYRLNKKVGTICLILYTIFLVFALLFELNVFFPVNLPMCSP